MVVNGADGALRIAIGFQINGNAAAEQQCAVVVGFVVVAIV